MLARILERGTITATTELADIRKAFAEKKKIWVELERHSADADEFVNDILKLHPLTVEDVWGPRSQPKIDDFPEYLYVIVHGMGSSRRRKLELVEVDIVIGDHWLVTHDRDGLVTDDVGTDLDHSPRMLDKGPAWLAHAVLDRVVDRYLPVIDELDQEVENLETDALEQAGTRRGTRVLERILQFKRTLQELRRMSGYQREILLRLSRGEYEEIPPDALPFYRDVYDHFLRIQDLTESYRDLVSSTLDAYLSVQSNRMNEVMKTLTLMSTVMLPLTFIAGIYGMNFDPDVSPWNMPELKWVHGYPFALILMAIVAIAIIVFFYKKGYIGGHGSASKEEHALEMKLKQMDRADHKKRRKKRAETNR